VVRTVLKMTGFREAALRLPAFPSLDDDKDFA